LTEVSTGSERLALEYDAARRVVRASDSAQHRVEYAYDSKGRLERAGTAEAVWTYAYGPGDELLNIKEPGREITNRFDTNGRLVFQTVRWPGKPDYSESFSYKVVDGIVVEADEREIGGLHTQYRFDEHSRTVVELYERPGAPPTMVQIERGPRGFVRAITVMCTKEGRRVSQSVEVEEDEERTKANAIASFCD
jgi:YD repeat-containing protein